MFFRVFNLIVKKYFKNELFAIYFCLIVNH